MVSRESGFTLLEVSFGLAIVGVIAVSIMATIVTCSKAQSYYRERAVAREAARSKMEEVLAWKDFCGLVPAFDGGEFDADVRVAPALGPVAEGDPVASVEVGRSPGSVSVVKLSPHLVRVVVRVEWQSPARGNQQYEISTRIVDEGLNILARP